MLKNRVLFSIFGVSALTSAAMLCTESEAVSAQCFTKSKFFVLLISMASQKSTENFDLNSLYKNFKAYRRGTEIDKTVNSFGGNSLLYFARVLVYLQGFVKNISDEIRNCVLVRVREKTEKNEMKANALLLGISQFLNGRNGGKKLMEYVLQTCSGDIFDVVSFDKMYNSENKNFSSLYCLALQKREYIKSLIECSKQYCIFSNDGSEDCLKVEMDRKLNFLDVVSKLFLYVYEIIENKENLVNIEYKLDFISKNRNKIFEFKGVSDTFFAKFSEHLKCSQDSISFKSNLQHNS